MEPKRGFGLLASGYGSIKVLETADCANFA